MRSMVGLLSVAGYLRRKEMFVACNDLRLLLNRACTSMRVGKKKAHMRSMVGLHLVAGYLRRKEMFVACNDLRLLLKPCPNEFACK